MGGESKSSETSFIEQLRAKSAEAEAAVQRAMDIAKRDREAQIAEENRQWAEAHFEKIRPILEKAAKMAYRESIALAIDPSDTNLISKIPREASRSDDCVGCDGSTFYRLTGKALSLASRMRAEMLDLRIEMKPVQELAKAEPHPQETIWKEPLKPKTSDFEHHEASIPNLIVLIATW